MTLIIHAGFPKTGTTFLQEHIFPQIKTHRYYGQGKSTAQSDAKAISKNLYRDFNTDDFRRAVDRLDNTIISDERLVKTLTKSLKLVDQIPMTEIDFQLMFGIRDQREILKSTYLGELRNQRMFPTYKQFVEAALQGRNPYVADLHYSEFFADLTQRGIPFSAYSYEKMFASNDVSFLEKLFDEAAADLFIKQKIRLQTGVTTAGFKQSLPSISMFSHIPKWMKKTKFDGLNQFLKRCLLAATSKTNPEEIEALDVRIRDHFAQSNAQLPEILNLC